MSWPAGIAMKRRFRFGRPAARSVGDLESGSSRRWWNAIAPCARAAYPYLGRLLLQLRSRTSRSTAGRQTQPCCIFQVQKRRNHLRCQAITVAGWTIFRAKPESSHTRHRNTQNRRSRTKFPIGTVASGARPLGEWTPYSRNAKERQMFAIIGQRAQAEACRSVARGSVPTRLREGMVASARGAARTGGLPLRRV